MQVEGQPVIEPRSVELVNEIRNEAHRGHDRDARKEARQGVAASGMPQRKRRARNRRAARRRYAGPRQGCSER
jgi:hypothetical protein